MPGFGRASVLLLLLCASTTACRDDPPDKEIQQAEVAIAGAKNAGAERYAHDEYVAALDALKHARDAIKERDYRLGLNHALDSREHAQTAAKSAVETKARVKADAERALREADASLADARSRLKPSSAGRVAPRLTQSAERTIATSAADVQKAREAFGAGDFAVVVSQTREVRARLQQVVQDLEAAATPAVRRRH